MIQLSSDYQGITEDKPKRKRTHPKRSDRRLDMAAMLGTRVGRLVLQSIGEPQGAHKTFLCVCDCGNTKTVRAEVLRRGATTSCGCYAKEIGKVTGRMGSAHIIGKMVGREFGLRTVLAVTEQRDKRGSRMYLTRCICGKEELHNRVNILRSFACRDCYMAAREDQLSDDDATP